MQIPLDDNPTALNQIRTDIRIVAELCDLCSARAAWKFISPVSSRILALCLHHSSKTPIPTDWQEIPL